MARVGINPARGKQSDYRPSDVTLAMLTYIPDLSGYFQDRLKILQLVLDSLNTNTAKPCDLIVFDNNSSPAVQDFLRTQQSQGLIDYLLISNKNIGKIGALRILFEAAPGEIIAYTDDDILFYPGWLEAHLEILESFPKVGMVSGTPVRNAAGHANSSLDALKTQNVPGLTVSREQRIAEEWEADWAYSTGRNVEDYLAKTRQHVDDVLRIETGDQNDSIEAIGSANHFQFLTPKRVILQALPSEWNGKLMGQMVELDEAVDELGYLRLSTTIRYTRHIGNVYSTDISKEAKALGLREDTARPAKTNQTRIRHWTLRIPGMRRIYMAIYQQMFDLLYR